MSEPKSDKDWSHSVASIAASTLVVAGVLEPPQQELAKENKPPPGLKWHQQLTENYGARKLVSRCYEVIGMAKTCHSIRELRQKVADHYGKEPVQLTLYLPKGEGTKFGDDDGLLKMAETLAWKDDEAAN